MCGRQIGDTWTLLGRWIEGASVGPTERTRSGQATRNAHATSRAGASPYPRAQLNGRTPSLRDQRPARPASTASPSPSTRRTKRPLCARRPPSRTPTGGPARPRLASLRVTASEDEDSSTDNAFPPIQHGQPARTASPSTRRTNRPLCATAAARTNTVDGPARRLASLRATAFDDEDSRRCTRRQRCCRRSAPSGRLLHQWHWHTNAVIMTS